MIIRLSLLLYFLLGIGIFSQAQTKKTAAPKVENGEDAIPVTVVSKKKANKPPPPPPPAAINKAGKPMPPPKVEAIKFVPPKIVKDPKKLPPPPPPPPAKPKTEKAAPVVKPDAPPHADERA